MEMFVSVLSAFKVIRSQQGFKVILFSELTCLQGRVREMASINYQTNTKCTICALNKLNPGQNISKPPLISASFVGK